MQVKILLFGHLAELTGENSIVVDNINDTDQLVQWVQKRYPQLAGVPFAVAVEMNFITENTELQDNNTIALLPPYSGG